MKIIVLDGFALNPGDLSWNILRNMGECRIFDRTKPEEVFDRIQDADIIITNKVVIDKLLIDRLPALKYIGVTATGYNVVDVQAASSRNIVVTNIPAYSTESVAQLVFSHILNVANRIELHANSVKEGEWTRNPDFSYWQSPQMELAGKTIGIVGFGRIGRKVAEIALAFGMKVIFQNRSQKADIPEGIVQKNISEVFAESDFVSLNCPLSAENSAFVNQSLLKTMKTTAVLVNTGRGGLINETDLAEALNSGQIAAACLDVLSTEPPLPENPLISARNCFITPHIAWATIEARQRLMNITGDNLNCFLSGSPQNVVME
ncbi:MAG TPA: D-2-hydroxyacid dehydrogenase [Prolixibacteraceae bacterium]|nr:D-2-hydroxyacid dehydrogenase [Prolixibacteraceae bacterium]